MAGRTRNLSTPYLGKSTTAKTMVAAFAAFSVAYAVFPQTCQICHLTVEKIWMKPYSVTIYVLR